MENPTPAGLSIYITLASLFQENSSVLVKNSLIP
jgi:hypothetical protein